MSARGDLKRAAHAMRGSVTHEDDPHLQASVAALAVWCEAVAEVVADEPVTSLGAALEFARVYLGDMPETYAERLARQGDE